MPIDRVYDIIGFLIEKTALFPFQITNQTQQNIFFVCLPDGSN